MTLLPGFASFTRVTPDGRSFPCVIRGDAVWAITYSDSITVNGSGEPPRAPVCIMASQGNHWCEMAVLEPMDIVATRVAQARRALGYKIEMQSVDLSA